MRTRGIGRIRKTDNPGTTLQSVRFLCYFIYEDHYDDPEFLPLPWTVSANPLFDKIFTKMCMEMKKNGLRGEGPASLTPHLDQTVHQCQVLDFLVSWYFMGLFQILSFFLPVRVASDQIEVKKCAVFSFIWVISFLKKKREISPKFFKCQQRVWSSRER